jgi:hypothetical protein
MARLSKITWIYEESDELHLDEVIEVPVGVQAASVHCDCGALHRVSVGRGLENHAIGLVLVTCPTCRQEEVVPISAP